MKKNNKSGKQPKQAKDDHTKDRDNFRTFQSKNCSGSKEVDPSSKVSQIRRNDPQWYVPNEQIAKDTANIPFNLFNGIKYQIIDPNVSQMPNDGPVGAKSTANPGINLFNYIPWYGNSGSGQGLELATQALFAAVRAANAGRVNYEAPDLMMYILCMDQIYLRIHELLRVLRLINTYAYKNREIPRALINMLGFDFDDLNMNQAKYRALINTLIYKANGLAVPAKFDIFKRRAILGSVVLTDDPERPTQLIVPRADGYFYLNETFKTGTTLNYKGHFEINTKTGEYTKSGPGNIYFGNQLNFRSMCEEIGNELDHLLLSSDINIMAGDIMKAFGDDLHSLGNISEFDTIEFTHDKELLTQFSNSTVVDNPYAVAMVYYKNPGDLSEAKVPLTSLCFAAPYADGADLNLGLQQRPIISQKDGRILTGVYIFGGFSAEQITVGGNKVNVPKTMGNAKKLTAFTALPMRIFDDNKDPATNLERSRLMMMTELGDSAINHYFFEDKDGINTSYREVSVSRCHKLVAGTEIGLGWITSFMTLGEHTNNYVNGFQYFQFGKISNRSVDQGGKFEWSQVSMNQYGVNWASIYEDESDQQSVNISAVALSVEGMYYGPLTYPCDTVYSTDAPQNAVAFWFYSLVTYATGNNTALIATQTLKQMHDTALLGLMTPKLKLLSR